MSDVLANEFARLAPHAETGVFLLSSIAREGT